MNEFHGGPRLSEEPPDNEIPEIGDDHPSRQEIHAPAWDWEDDEDWEGAEITRVFIPFSRGNANDSG